MKFDANPMKEEVPDPESLHYLGVLQLFTSILLLTHVYRIRLHSKLVEGTIDRSLACHDGKEDLQ